MSDPVVTVEIVEDVTEVTVSPRVTTVDAVEQPLTIDLQENTTTVELRGISIASSNAGAISIDNSNNYLTSTSVQGAINELTNSLTAGPGISFSAGVISNVVELSYKADGEENLETIDLDADSLIFSGTANQIDVSAPANQDKITFGLSSILQNVITDQGSATSVPQISVDLKGRITSATSVPIQISKSSVTSLISTLESHSSGELANTQAIATNSAAIAANAASIESHSSTLLSHAALINTNIQDIETISGAIVANNQKVDSISSTVVGFTSDLETNSGKILANTVEIQTNSAALTTKYDKSGGTITGNANIEGSLTVGGTSTNLDVTTFNVEADNINLNAVRNAQGTPETIKDGTSGIYIYTGTVAGTPQYKKFEYNINEDKWTLEGSLSADYILDSSGNNGDGFLSSSSGVLSWQTFSVTNELETLSSRILATVSGLSVAANARTGLESSISSLADSSSANLLAIHSLSSRNVTNVTNIETNSGKIVTNLSKIETNSGLIAALSPTRLESVSAANLANTAEIESNSGKIASNLAKIETNSSLIVTNISAIETNSGKIASNLTKIQTNSGLIATNISDIETNSGKIASNLTKIQTNSGLIATNISDIKTLSGRILANTAEIESNSAKTASNLAKIETNSGLIAANTTAIETNSGKIASNLVEIESNSSKIASNLSKIHTNSGLIAANTTGIETNSGKIASNLTKIQTNSAKLVDVEVNQYIFAKGYYSLPKGRFVYAASYDSSDGKLVIAPCDADGAGQMPAIGCVSDDGGASSVGGTYYYRIQTFGLVHGIDTSGFGGQGGLLYVGTNNAGIPVTTPPVATFTDVQQVATVVKYHATDGVIFVDCHNVDPPANLLLQNGEIAYGGPNGEQTATLSALFNNVSNNQFSGTMHTLSIRAAELGTLQRQNPAGPELVGFAEIDGSTDSEEHTNRTIFYTHIQNDTADTGATTLVNPAPGGTGYGYNLGYSLTWGYDNTNYGYTNAMFGGDGTIPRLNNANIVGGWGNSFEGTGSDRNLLVGGSNKLGSGCIDNIVAGNGNFMTTTAYSIMAGNSCRHKGTGSLTFGQGIINDVANQSIAVGASPGSGHTAIAAAPNKYHWTAANYAINIGYANAMGEGADYSACFGYQNRVGSDDELQENLINDSDTTPYTFGEVPNKPARYSLVAGRSNQLKESSYSLVAGYDNTANSDYTYILGRGCETAGNAGVPFQALIGKYLISPKHSGNVNIGEAQTVVGRYNDTGSFDANLRNMPDGGWYQDNTHLFTVGSGTNTINRKNSFIIIPRQTDATTARDFCGIAMPILAESASYDDDEDAADGGVPVGGLYRTGSTIKIRVS